MYATPPSYILQDAEALREWNYDAMTVLTLNRFYGWYWADDQLVPVHTEVPFVVPVRNPSTTGVSRTWEQRGVIDLISHRANRPDRLLLVDYKTTSKDMAEGSRYRRQKFHLDSQLTGYLYAAHECGLDVRTILYDVVRKPTIGPTDIPEVDAQGVKIVVDPQGNRVKNASGIKWDEKYAGNPEAPPQPKDYWKQSSSGDDKLVTRPMTCEEWAVKLAADIEKRPEYYFARFEVPRTQADIEAWQKDQWDDANAMAIAEKEGRYPRNEQACDQFGLCCYFETCCAGIDLLAPNARIPNGFQYVPPSTLEISE
jgi:hypothetical protein